MNARIAATFLAFLTLSYLNPNPAAAQTFVGTNAPGAVTNFMATSGHAVTNIAFIVPGSATTYSHVFVRKGIPPTETEYDFVSRFNGGTNAIYLEQPEVVPINWFIRIKTPATSQAHGFTLQVETDRTGLRGASKPVMKPVSSELVGTATNGNWQYFRVELTDNTPWQVRVEASGTTSPDLYIQRGRLPLLADYLRRSVGAINDSITFLSGDIAPGPYFIGVIGTSVTPADYSLILEPLAVESLAWDPGTTHEGTETVTNLTRVGGDYYFRITTANPALGAWRTALNVLSGEANLYLGRGRLPSPTDADFRSEREGSDGFVLSSSRFLPNEDWYLLVKAEDGAQWRLVSGSPFVTDLGTVATGGGSGSGEVEIGPEGVRYFRTAVPPDLLAWRLWLHGSNNLVFLRKSSVPLPTENEMVQAGQMLVVPPYLDPGQHYFIGVAGAPGNRINLDSRAQEVFDLPYGSAVTTNITGYGYVTYRVEVPLNQIAWQITLPSTNGNPNITIRRRNVPNENYNDAFSEFGSNQLDHITLVPPLQPDQPGLSDGTFYLTVYATNTFHFTLDNRPAAVTDIPYVSVTVNNEPGRIGWRFFRVTDINAQLSSLGWDLFVTNASPGTRLAVRRNAAPGIWSRHSPNLIPVNYHDALSTADYLQRPDHPADVWYVGVFNPTNALGSFTLVTRELPSTPLADQAPITRTNHMPGRWDFYRLELPASLLSDSGDPVLGWDVRLTNVLGGSPKLVIRKDGFPTSFTSTLTPGGNNWPSGRQWAAGSDWTRRTFAPDGLMNEDGRILAMGVGRPLEPGSYYVGVLDNQTTNTGSYTIVSRWIGTNSPIRVRDLAWDNAAVTNTVAPREADYYRVILPEGAPSWRIRLNTLEGEAMMIVQTSAVPSVVSEKRLQKNGREQYVRLPAPGQAELTAGTNFIAVIGEGLNPGAANRISEGTSRYALELLGPLVPISLGTVGPTPLTYTDPLLEAGAVRAYRLNMSPTSKGFWITLENTAGNPWMVGVYGTALPDPSINNDLYGNEGGLKAGAVDSPDMLVGLSSYPDSSFVVKARSLATEFPDAAYTVRVREIVPEVVPFDGGTFTVSDAPATEGRFFYIDVPFGALGWDLRLTGVTGGNPRIYVRHGEGLAHPSVTDLVKVTDTAWPLGQQYNVGRDWTERPQSANGTIEDGRVFAVGMGRPLEPGRYSVGVFGTGNTMSFTLESRGIGPGLAIPVLDLAFTNGVVETNLPVRSAAYYRVVVPTNVPSWKVWLSATSGESMLAVLKDALPGIGTLPTHSTVGASAGRKMQKDGDEHFLLLPDPGQGTVRAGTYYLAVVSEGQNATNSSRVGTGSSLGTLHSVGVAPVQHLGTIGPDDTVIDSSLGAGEVQLYQFSVPAGTLNVEARLENSVGYPVMTLGPGERIPNPSATGVGVASEIPLSYGTEGGQSPGTLVHPRLINVANPTNAYALAVKARGFGTTFSNATHTLRLNASGAAFVEFDGGAISISNQAPNTWRFFRLTVPPTALGWDVRLINVAAGMPRIVVRRGTLPSVLTTTPWSSPGLSTSWPTNSQWAPGSDWTRRNLSPDNVDESGRVLAVGMGRPLEPGTYYVGVINQGVSTAPMTYTLLSRGIGPGLAIPVEDLPYSGSATNLALAPREAAYYRVVVPSNAPSWKVRLAGISGECMMSILNGAVPNIDSVNATIGTAVGKGMQKPGNEHFVLLPVNGFVTIPAGTNYIAVVGEGLNPSAATRVGAGPSSFILSSEGALPVTSLGTLTSEDLVWTDALDGGETRAYRFYVPSGTYGVKLLLENRVGNPVAVMRQGEAFADPGVGGAGLAQDPYGNEGGYPGGEAHPSLVTVANTAPGICSVTVKGRRLTSTSTPDSSYRLRLQEVLVPQMNFGAAENTNGLNNVVSGQLQDNERAFFKVIIPESIGGQPVIGWKLDLMQSSGQAQMRVRRDQLPSDALSSSLMPFTANSAVIAPPYLTNGTWFIEVKAIGSTAFTLTSNPLSLERPPWIMPPPESTNVAPGLAWPEFGDTGTGTNGLPLPGNRSIFLEQGYLHYYAVEVPSNNVGLLRVQLEAISGNPDLYARAGNIPTLYHNASGANGYLYDRTMLASGTEYANWVPIDGKKEFQLQPGTWYLAVRAAGNANTEYRLRVSTGSITDLPIHGPGVSGQTLAGGDWRYYRVQVPTLVPFDFDLNFSQQAGDIVVYVRDRIPPGNGATGVDYRDWFDDLKNDGPYPNFDLPGSYLMTVPPVRPGQIYYFGVRAVSDASFTIGFTTNGTVGVEPPIIPFYGGTVVTNLPPRGQALYRVDVPPEAIRWKHVANHVIDVRLFLEPGTIPAKAPTDTWRSTTANSQLNQALIGPWNPLAGAYNPPVWPWLPGQAYFLTVTNASDSVQPFTFAMDGRNPTTDDNDNDALPDLWELESFGTLSYRTTDDPDRDGVNNITELFDGTNPNDPASFRAILMTFALNGSVQRQPDLSSYQLGDQVVLIAVPDPGYSFVRWSGQASGRDNPLILTVDGHKTNIFAEFKLAGDDFDTALLLSGTYTRVQATNVGMTKELGEPFHAGNPGGKSIWWQWTAPVSGTVDLSTAGSAFDTLLAVYTGETVSGLTLVASDHNSLGGTNRSNVRFGAVAGTAYHIAVDGYNGASSRLALSLDTGASSANPCSLAFVERLANGSVRFRVSGDPNRVYQLEVSTNLTTWTSLAPVTTAGDGTAWHLDAEAASHPNRFYRGQAQ